MDRGGLARFMLIGLVVFVAFMAIQKFFGKEDGAAQPLRYEYSKTAADEGKPRAPEQHCDIWTHDFHAQLSSRGASLEHFYLLTAKYKEDEEPIDLSTTPDKELRRQLRVHWRNAAVGDDKAPWQTKYASFDWTLAESSGKRCVFSYADDQVSLTKTIEATDRAYELAVSTKIENLDDEPRIHAASIETTAWRTQDEVTGKMFRMSPYLTHVECVSAEGTTERKAPGDFEPGDFEGEGFHAGGVNPGDWYQSGEPPSVAAVSNMYFAHAVLPTDAPAKPVCQLQIENWGDKGDPNRGAMYRARLAYPKQQLAPGGSAEYRVLAYVGPKQRDILASAAGGNRHLDELIDLGFFSDIAKVLVAFLLAVHGVIPNWGIAIIILTITARTLLFPLTLPSIKNMVRMRQLKPEIDALNEKYKDDAQQKGLAQMELWRKHGVNPFKGCLPQIASMPVWFALYTTLQTAVELFNIPFLWFPDLSKPDPLYILPFIIGSTTFLQQKLMPQQGDAAQQKMMMYFMPSMFVVFMFFLPSGLGVYMFTNGLIGILQQQVVEWRVRKSSQSGGSTKGDIDVKVKSDEPVDDDDQDRGKGKKKRRAKDDDDGKVPEGRPLLDKGRA